MSARAPGLLCAVTLAASLAASGAHAQAPPAPAEGTATVSIDSEGEPLSVVLTTHEDKPVTDGASCTTPCTLVLPLGRIALDYGAPGRFGRTERLSLGPGGARLVLHPPPPLPPPPSPGRGPSAPPQRSMWSSIGVNLGTVLAVSGLASLLAAAGTLTTGQTLYGNQRTIAYSMLGVGPAMILGGVVLFAVSR